jgi:hypothetical protein
LGMERVYCHSVTYLLPNDAGICLPLIG